MATIWVTVGRPVLKLIPAPLGWVGIILGEIPWLFGTSALGVRKIILLQLHIQVAKSIYTIKFSDSFFYIFVVFAFPIQLTTIYIYQTIL